MKIKLSVLSLVCLLVTGALAQTYSINWYKIAGGGGTSSGGVYSLSGTIGQPDASPALTGGAYSLTGGFWALYAVQTASAPFLSIFGTGTNAAIVAWPIPATTFRLQQNSNVLNTNGWVTVTNPVVTANGTNRVTIYPATGNQYFRLIYP